MTAHVDDLHDGHLLHHARGSRGQTLLSFMGVTNVMFVRAENLAFGPEAREKAIDAARSQRAAIGRRFTPTVFQ
jgi:hypothetical protein